MKRGSEIRKLEDLIIWQKAKDLGKFVYLVTGQGTFLQDFPLRDQIRKAVISVSSNIAEGFGRYNPGEFKNFLSIASGSTSEVKSQVYLAKEIGHLTEPEADRLIHMYDEIIRMISGLRRKIYFRKTK